MSANYYSGQIKLNGQKVGIPYGYFSNLAGSQPPYPVQQNSNSGRYVNWNFIQYQQGIPALFNTGCPVFWIIKDSVWQEPWLTIYNNDGTEYNVMTLGNGNYMKSTHRGGAGGYFECKWYTSDNILIATTNIMSGFAPPNTSNYTQVFYTIFVEDDVLFGGQVSFYNNLQIFVAPMLQTNSAISGYDRVNERFVDGAAPINYNWKSVKALTLAKPSELGLPGMPVLPDTNQTDMLLSYIPDEYLNDGEVVTGGTHFEIKAPSLGQYITEYNDSSFTERSIFLSNKHFVKIGRKNVGISGEQYKFTFLSGVGVIPQITYYETTISVGLTDGVPYLGFIIDTQHNAVRLNVIFVKTGVDLATGLEIRTVDYNTITMNDSEMSQLYAWLNGSESQAEDNDSGVENPTQGGNETDDVTNTPLNRPTLPTRGAVGSGFVKVYEVGDAELQDICEFMWDDSLLTNLGRLFSDPREIIVGLMVFPITPIHTTSNSPIYAGNLDTGVTGNLLTSEYETRYAGSRRVPKGNNDFMSFAPYRRIKINIPYCGEHELDPSAVFGATLKLYYHLSFFSGNCIAEITRTFDGGEEEPIAFYGGQMGYSIPLSSEDFTRTLSSLISAGVTIGTALCTYGASSAAAATSKKAAVAAARQGSANAALTGSVAGAAGGLLNGSLAPNVSYNSGGGANSGFLGCQQPYLIIDEAITAYDKDQSSYIGYTSYQTKKLSNCVGYTKCLEAHIEGVHASDSELEEIMSWLTNGVLIHQDGTATPSTTPTVAGNTVITMMKLTSERNVIGKKWIDESQIEGQLIYDQSITSPSILVNGNSINFNYAYIGLFNRFYFVSDVIVRNKDLIEVKLKSDPLQSFKDEILNCYASVDRQKHNGNKFIDDPYMWTQVNNNVKILPFMDGGIEFDFGHTEDSYILTIAGKG